MDEFKKFTNITLFLLIIYYVITQTIILFNTNNTSVDRNTFLVLQSSLILIVTAFIIYVIDLVTRLHNRSFSKLFILNSILLAITIPAVVKTILLNLHLISF